MDKARFCQLYDHCQTLTPKVGRNEVIDKLKELTGQKVRVIKGTLDTSVMRGFFLSASNTEHPLVKAHGFNVIVIARDLNTCWERFVNVKEAMHLLDDDGDLADTPDKFERLLNDWGSPSLTKDQTTASDVLAIWMALACLCPEKNRLEFQGLREKEQTDNYEIALQLRIPEQYVPLLFRPEFPRIIEMLRK